MYSSSKPARAILTDLNYLFQIRITSPSLRPDLSIHSLLLMNEITRHRYTRVLATDLSSVWPITYVPSLSVEVNEIHLNMYMVLEVAENGKNIKWC